MSSGLDIRGVDSDNETYTLKVVKDSNISDHKETTKDCVRHQGDVRDGAKDAEDEVLCLT